METLLETLLDTLLETMRERVEMGSSSLSEETLIVKEIPENSYWSETAETRFIQIGDINLKEMQGDSLMQSECESKPSKFSEP